jgi:DNA-binding MarR family transcriptional regulator
MREAPENSAAEAANNQEPDFELADTFFVLGELFLHEMHRFATQKHLDLVHLRTLAFLRQANKYSDSPASLTEYLGLTKGTVSTSITLLETRGLLIKIPDDTDRRRVHLQLTDSGRTVAASFGAHMHWEQLASQLPPEQLPFINSALKHIVQTSQQLNHRRTFGQCQTCRHFQPRGDGGFCMLTQEPLTPVQTRQRCREHESPSTDTPHDQPLSP